MRFHARSSGTQYGMGSDSAGDWATAAPCRDADPELFSPLQHAHKKIAEAVAVCQGCPAGLQLQCLIDGAATGDEWTVRGGLTGPERLAHHKAGLRPEQYPAHQPGLSWCRRCHQSYRWDADRPQARMCPGCDGSRVGRSAKPLGICVECEQPRPIHGGGKCSTCLAELRRAGLKAVANASAS